MFFQVFINPILEGLGENLTASNFVKLTVGGSVEVSVVKLSITTGAATTWNVEQIVPYYMVKYFHRNHLSLVKKPSLFRTNLKTKT